MGRNIRSIGFHHLWSSSFLNEPDRVYLVRIHWLVSQHCFLLHDARYILIPIIFTIIHIAYFFFLGYIIYRVLYQSMMMVASFEIVKELSSNGLDCFALVFGINMFFALGAQTVLTAVVNSVLELTPRTQFLVYSAFYIVPMLFFLLLICRRIYTIVYRNE